MSGSGRRGKGAPGAPPLLGSTPPDGLPSELVLDVAGRLVEQRVLWSEPSRGAGEDASRAPAEDASRSAECDAFPRARRDASPPGARDASPRGPRDGSARMASGADLEPFGPPETEPTRPGLLENDGSGPGRRRSAFRVVSREASPLEEGNGWKSCRWCRGPIPYALRVDAHHCSARCRKRWWRFARDVGRVAAADQAKTVAVADPPYPGHAYRYVGHPDFGGEVDHRALLSRLQAYDAWALCSSSSAVQGLYQLCHELGIVADLAIWNHGARVVRARKPLDAFDVVLYRAARDLPTDDQVPNLFTHGVGPRLGDPGRVVGAKPAAFADWLFRLLQLRACDELDDLFPGSGGIGRAWDIARGVDASHVDDGDASPSSRGDG